MSRRNCFGRPTTPEGQIGDVLKDKIVYGAATISGDSGGPRYNRDGIVIGVNFATLSGFGGSHLAVPVRYADEVVKQDPMSGRPSWRLYFVSRFSADCSSCSSAFSQYESGSNCFIALARTPAFLPRSF